MVTYSGMASFSPLLLQLWRGYEFISMSIYPSVVTLYPIGRVSETIEFVIKLLTQDAEIRYRGDDTCLKVRKHRKIIDNKWKLICALKKKKKMSTWYLKHCSTVLVGKVFLGFKQTTWRWPPTHPLPFRCQTILKWNDILVKLSCSTYLPFASVT